MQTGQTDEANLQPIDMIKYQEKKCGWTVDGRNKEQDPHFHTKVCEKKKIYNNILEAICWSPMVRLNRIPAEEGVKCEILAKCEYYLPGGSLKDRTARRMVDDAEKRGDLKPGVSTIIEATSGNTGIGLALAGAVKGYDVIITLPEKMSQEKCDTLTALGAKIIRTPTEAAFVDLDSHMGVARKMRNEIPDSVILDQYCNPSNALVHYDETAEEIWEQCEGKVDYVVMTAGTGGTVTGISRKLKEKNPDIKIIGVDPLGSIIAYPEELNSEGVHGYKVEGIGYDFIPKNCDRTGNIDQWVKSNDYDSFRMSRRLIRQEGLLAGGSSGAALSAAIQVAKNLPEDKRVVVVFTDSIRNYMTKFLNDDWMLENAFLSQEEYDQKHFTEDVKTFADDKTIRSLGLKEVIPVTNATTVKDTLDLMAKQNVECLPVLNEKGELMGLVTQRQMTILLASFKLGMNSTIAKGVQKDFKKLSADASLKYLPKAFQRYPYIVVEETDTGLYSICENKHLLDFMLKEMK